MEERERVDGVELVVEVEEKMSKLWEVASLR